MVTRRLSIKEKHREYPIRIVQPTDFTVEPGEEISPESVVADPNLTLYCIDRANDSALFVESADQEATDRAPFYYQGQFDNAKSLVSMPLSVFHKVAESIAEPPKGIIWIHSVGRCGSTLLSKALSAVPEVHSLSEPDEITQMLDFREPDGSADEWIHQIILSSTRWRCKPRMGAPAEFVAIKMRSEAMALWDLFCPDFSHSKHLYLYRDGLAWIRTSFRAFPEARAIYDQELNEKMEGYWSRSLPLVRALRVPGAPMNPIQCRMLAWATCMEAYLSIRGAGIPILAARFEDLTAQSIPFLKQLFEFCGIQVQDWQAIEEVLGRDSQEGTIYARDHRSQFNRQLTPELVQDVYDVIGRRPLLQTPGVVLPGTVVC